MKLSRQEEIALLLSSELAKNGIDYLSLASVSEKHGVSVLFLKKIASALKKHAIIESKEGMAGGYRLKKDVTRISALDILNAVSQRGAGTRHVLQYSCPLHAACLPQKIRQLVGDAFTRYLSDMTLDQFVKSTKKELYESPIA